MGAAIPDPLVQYRDLWEGWRPDPERYVRERIGVRPSAQQRDLLRAIAPEGAKVSVRSGHNTGKTGGVAWAMLWFLETRPYCRVPVTAPTAHQLHDVLWAELSKWIRHADEWARRCGMPQALWLSSLLVQTKDRIYTPDAQREWYAVARTSGRDNPDALQGFHATDLTLTEDGTGVEGNEDDGNIMFVVDEASGVHDTVYEVAEGALASRGSRLIMTGNPTKLTGYFADSQRWRRGEYTTLHWRSSDSPLAAPDYRAQLVRKFGEGSNVVRVRADGEFPTRGDDVLISLEAAEAAVARALHDGAGHLPIRLGVDVARYGSDRTVLTVRQGANVLHASVHGRTSVTEVIGLAITTADAWEVAEIYVDEIGLGAGPVDGLIEHAEQQAAEGGPVAWEVYGVNVAKPAPGPDHGEEAARSLRDWLWLQGRDWIHHEDPSFAGMDGDHAQDLAGELATPAYSTDSSGRLVVESKDKLRGRGITSPDMADSLLLTFAPKPTPIFVG
ncbi:MAG TPA: hypothetical protein VKA64_04820 [Gammaproteobacteria bacterium]|nr:hypothetical protein [Gammaproteobacteria bacterium]